MNLQQLIDALATADPNRVCPIGFTNPHSYRGYYDQLAFEPAHDVRVSDMLACATGAIGATYSGYKGGEFTMDASTDVWLAEYGSTGETIGPVLLAYMLGTHNAGVKAAAEGSPATEGSEP